MGWLVKAWRSWATRSLAVGAVATLIDIGVVVLLTSALVWPTRISAMLGVAVGAAFTFFANRYFAFREHKPQLAGPAVKFVLATIASMVVHGQFVVWMRDDFGVPVVFAKVIADVAVFTFGQLLLLRFVIFPKAKPAPARVVPIAVEAPDDVRLVAER